MRLRTLVVIPVKDFGQAKTRLGPVLPPERRAALARRLCERTLAFFQDRLPEQDRLVVTASREIAGLARQYGAAVLLEPQAGGLSVAAQRAAEWSRRHGYEAQLLIPADIARLDESELRRLLDHRSRGPCVLICPASDAGTNALLTTPPDAIPFCFGERSSALHHAAALRRGLHCELLQMEHLRFDVDTPDDLDSLIQDNSGQGPQERVMPWNL